MSTSEPGRSPDPDPPAEPGQLGHFTLGALLGQGSAAHVWKAVHGPTGTPVAVKVLAEGFDEARLRAALRTEARAIASLSHPHVLWILDYGEVEVEGVQTSTGPLRLGAPYLVMELADGGTLANYAGHPVGWSDLRDIILAILDGLAHAHARGVVHLDLKPTNVLVGGQRPGLKLADFGLAHIAPRIDAAGVEGQAGGTPGYMAPEQFSGAWRDYGPWTDLYALGSLVWSLATGRRPFRGKRFVALMNQHLHKPLPAFEPLAPVPEGFETWLRTCLAKDPQHRFQFAADAAWILQQLPDVVDAPELVPPMPSEPVQRTTLVWGSRSSSIARERFAEVAPVSRRGFPALRVRPAVPRDWRRGPQAATPWPLVGTGLGLFGLRQVPLIGRIEERDRLWEELRYVARQGSVRSVAIHGGAGAGKGRLSRWLVERAHEVGATRFFEVRHGPILGARDGIGPMLSRAFECDGLDRSQILERVGSLLPEGTSADEAEAITEIIAPTTPEQRSAGVPGVQFRAPTERYAVVERILIRERRPVVLWMDDVHWGLDALGLSQFLLLRQRCDALILWTIRDDRLPRAHRRILSELSERDDVTRIDVGPLRDDDVDELAGRQLPLSSSLATRLRQRSGGSPLYVVQVLAHWVAADLLELDANGFRLKEGTEAWLPADLQAVWRARLFRVVRDRDGRSLEIAAALGLEIDHQEWRAVCEHAGVTPSPSLLEALWRLRLATVTEGGFALAHGMLRDALADEARRQGRWGLWHRSCAAVLARGSGSGLAERVGRHHVAACAHADALACFTTAFDEHLDRDDFQHAEDLLDDWGQAWRSSKISPRDPRSAEGIWRYAYLRMVQAHVEEANTVLTQLEDRATRYHWPPSGARMMIRGSLLRGAGDLAGATEMYSRARQLAEERSDPKGLVRACKHQAEGNLMQGHHEAARECVAAGLAVALEAGDDYGAASLFQVRAGLALRAGDLPQASEAALRCIEYAKRCGNRLMVGQGLYVQGGIAEARDALDEAADFYHRAIAQLRDADEITPRSIAVSLARLELLGSRWVEARTVLQPVLQSITGTWGVLEAVSSLGLAVAAAGLGEVGVAEAHLTVAETRIAETGYRDPFVSGLAEQLAGLVDPELARRAWALARVQHEALDDQDGLQRVQLALGALGAAT